MRNRLGVAALVAAALSVLGYGLASAASTSQSLNAGDSVNVGCAGPSLSWQQTDATDGVASCAANPVLMVGSPTGFGSTNSGAPTTPLPSGTAAGDVLVSAVESWEWTTINCPSGWAQQVNTVNGTATRLVVCTTVATASQSNPVASVVPPTGDAMVTAAFSGVNPSDPIAAASGASGLLSPSVAATSGSLAVFAEGSNGWNTSGTIASGATVVGSFNNQNNSQVAMATSPVTGSMAGPVAWTTSGSAVAATLSLNPAASGPAATTTTVVPTTTTTVAPTTTTTVPSSSGGTCTTPVVTETSATQTYNTDPSDGHQYWWVNNDAWNGSHGPQTLAVCSESSWTATSNQTDNSGAVETYPDTEYDIGGRATPSTKTIGQWNSITSTFSEAFPTDGSMDAAYDLWTDNYKNETMIWNQWSGDNDYWGNKAMTSGIAVTLGGVPYHVLVQSPTLTIFFADNQTTSGTVDILAAWQWELANGHAVATDVPTQIEYGVEIIGTFGAETFPMTGMTVSVN